MSVENNSASAWVDDDIAVAHDVVDPGAVGRRLYGAPAMAEHHHGRCFWPGIGWLEQPELHGARAVQGGYDMPMAGIGTAGAADGLGGRRWWGGLRGERKATLQQQAASASRQ